MDWLLMIIFAILFVLFMIYLYVTPLKSRDDEGGGDGGGEIVEENKKSGISIYLVALAFTVAIIASTCFNMFIPLS